ncbi:15133_t:CDS:2, partial [Racocetra persica]
ADDRFWQDFNSSYEEVLINEFKDQIKYLKLLNLLDSKDYMIRFSANTNVRFIYDFCENEKLKAISEQKFNNTKLFSSFVNRLDYIVEFKKFREDNKKLCREECPCCKIRMIFHKEKAREILENKYSKFEELNTHYTTLKHLTRLSPKLIKKYTKIFRDLIINTLTVNDSKLEGEYKIIKIDESKFKKDVSCWRGYQELEKLGIKHIHINHSKQLTQRQRLRKIYSNTIE